MADSYDVLVVGGGVAGCSAALSAVREGASVLLLEAHEYLGGNATRAMVGPWQSYHAARVNADGSLPEQVVGGIAQEFIDDLIARGATPGHITDPLGFAGSITPVNSDQVQDYLYEKLTGAGVTVQLSRPLFRQHLDKARQIIDTSGLAAAARMLGARVIKPENPQPMSWLFTMVGVDTDAVRQYQIDNPDQFVLHPAFKELRPDLIAVSGFFDLMNSARDKGELTIPRDRLLFFSTSRPQEVLVNTTRVPVDHPDSRYEALRQVHELVEWMPGHVPGFEHAELGRVADDIGQRETCRIVGKYSLSENDVVTGGRHPDAIARGSFPVDVHQADSAGLVTETIGGRGWYDIPLGCLESADIPNLLCAGRTISADSKGFASVRVLPTSLATGQAAGYVAARRAMGKLVEIPACLSSISLV